MHNCVHSRYQGPAQPQGSAQKRGAPEAAGAAGAAAIAPAAAKGGDENGGKRRRTAPPSPVGLAAALAAEDEDIEVRHRALSWHNTLSSPLMVPIQGPI